MATPSLLIIPDRYKAAKLYSQLPESGDGDFTVTRSTTATRVNASGLIESVASGVPRLDYAGGGCPSLLVEPAATNSIRNNTMVGAVTGTPGTLPTNWSESLGGLTREVVATGTENGVEYVDLRFHGTSSDTSLRIFTEAGGQIVASNGQVWTSSAYLKIIAASLPPNFYQLEIFERTAAAAFVALGSSTIVPTTSLQRFSFTRTLAGGVATERVHQAVRFSIANATAYDFTIRIGLPQMELGAVATSVIKTSTVAITRNADVISLSSVSGLIGQSQGYLYAEVDVSTLPGTTARTFIDIGFSGNRIFLGFTSVASNTIRLSIDTSAGLARAEFRAVISSTGTIKVAAAYKDGDCAMYVNGVAATLIANNSISFSTLSNVFLGSTISATAFLNDRIIAAAIGTTRLSNAELISLTTL